MDAADLDTPDLLIRRSTPADALAFADYLRRNATHLAPFVPLRPDGHDSEPAIRERLESTDRIQYVAMRGERLVGQCAISNVIRAPVFLSCTIGYDVDEHEQGRGIATRLVRHVAHDALTTHRLHRVEAGTLVSNLGSQRVLEKCGFTRIGIAPRHVRIAGRWQDHVLYVLTAEDLS
ncbi:MAG: GNAT family N-acetyltransferase [Thermoleophilia bacterium]|nr:GNAT family N-acetyltransferase [Thermoleophilia bacterium]